MKIENGMEIPCTLIIDNADGEFGILASVKELKDHGELLQSLNEDKLRETFDPDYVEYKSLKKIKEIEEKIQELNNEIERLLNEL